MRQGVPGLVWSLLIVFASGLVGCMLVFAAEASLSKAILVGVFTSSLTLALLTVRELDFPFESALQLSSRTQLLPVLQQYDYVALTGGGPVDVPPNRCLAEFYRQPRFQIYAVLHDPDCASTDG